MSLQPVVSEQDGLGLSYRGHTITMELMPNTDDVMGERLKP